MNEKLVKEKSCINNHNAKSFTIQAENLIEILLKIFPVLAFLNHIVRSNGLFSSDVRKHIMVSNFNTRVSVFVSVYVEAVKCVTYG